jgi:hypothetical protein
VYESGKAIDMEALEINVFAAGFYWESTDGFSRVFYENLY